MPPSRPVDRPPPARPRILDRALLRSWPLPVDDDGDKTTRGTALVIGGSTMTAGAVVLAGIAALRMGAGRLQVATAAPSAISMSVALPEAMVIPLAVDDLGRVLADQIAQTLEDPLGCADAVLIGPGLARETAADKLLAALLAMCRPDAPIVLDAVAMSGLVDIDETLAAALRGRLILTPNRSELAGLTEGSDQRPVREATMDAALRWGAVVTSFGEVASSDGRRWATLPATPGLGTSGSGDVLAGLAVGAGARCADAAQAACWATYAHNEAGNRLSRRMGRLGFIARELLGEVPLLFAELERSPDAS